LDYAIFSEPIAMWRILKVIDGKVQFVAKDTKKETMVPTWCTLDRFVCLLASHVPDKYRHGIRYFGLLAPRVKNQHYAGLFLLLGQQMLPRPQRLSWRKSVKKYFGFDPMIDSIGQEMRWV
jgi:Putative transposase